MTQISTSLAQSLFDASTLLAQQGDFLGGNVLWLAFLVVLLIIGLAFFAIFARYFRLWIQSVTTGAGVGFLDLVRMTFRKVNPTVITRSKIMAVQTGLTDGQYTEVRGEGLDAGLQVIAGVTSGAVEAAAPNPFQSAQPQRGGRPGPRF